MINFLKNRSPIIWALILVTMLILTWLFPSSRFIIQATFILVSLALASLVVVAKNRELYGQGKFPRSIFLRNSIIDILGVLLAMTFAGLLAKYLVQSAMGETSNEIARFVAAIATGLLVGIIIGVLIRRIRGHVLTALHK